MCENGTIAPTLGGKYFDRMPLVRRIMQRLTSCPISTRRSAPSWRSLNRSVFREELSGHISQSCLSRVDSTKQIFKGNRSSICNLVGSIGVTATQNRIFKALSKFRHSSWQNKFRSDFSNSKGLHRRGAGKSVDIEKKGRDRETAILKCRETYMLRKQTCMLRTQEARIDKLHQTVIF